MSEPVDNLSSSSPETSRSSEWDPDREPVEELAGEFVERRRRGERVSIDDYVAQYPDLATDIRQLFPAILAMERLNRRAQQDSRPLVSKQEITVERLGDFRVIGEIARGGMGIVYEAEQVTLGRRVAVKVLPKQALRGEKDVQRFHREAQTSAKLHHTNIVPVFGVGEQDGMHYLVMQFIQGVGLDEILLELKRLMLESRGESGQPVELDSARSSYVKRNAAALLREKLRGDTTGTAVSDSSQVAGMPDSLLSSTSRIQPETQTNSQPATAIDRDDRRSPLRVRIDPEYWRNIALIGVQAANALQYAHIHGTLHRDVKPGNLLLDGEGVVWVADFGLAKAVEQEDVTWTGDIVGTLSYMAPERFNGACDERSDIYGLGLTLYELLTFERAFEGSDRVALMHRVATENLASPRRRNPAIPRDLETIVMKAAARDPEDRYQAAADLAADLQCYLEDRPIKARRVNPAEQLSRWCRRNRALASLTATVAALLFLVSLVTTIGYLREASQRQRAESSERMALAALDKIYSQFAPSPLQLPALQSATDEGGGTVDEENEAVLLAVQTQLPLSKDVAKLLDNLLLFYDQLSQQTGDDQMVLFKSIKSHRRVADIQSRLGEFEDAQARYEQAIERAAKFDISSEEARLELARIYNGMGSILVAQRNREQGVQAHERALKLLNDRSAAPESKYELARTMFLLHQAQQRPWWQRQRNSDVDTQPTASIDRAIALLDELSKNQPDVPEYQFLLAKCYRAVAEANRDDVSDAEGRTIKQLESLVKRYPDAPDFRYELADAYSVNDVRSLFWNREYPEPRLQLAERRLRRSLQVASNIDVTHPDILQYVTLANRLHYTMAVVLNAQGQKEEARRHLDTAIARQERIVQNQPGLYRQRMWLANLHVDLAQLLSELDRPDSARSELMRIEELLAPVGMDSEGSDSSGFVKRRARRIRQRAENLMNALQ